MSVKKQGYLMYYTPRMATSEKYKIKKWASRREVIISSIPIFPGIFLLCQLCRYIWDRGT